MLFRSPMASLKEIKTRLSSVKNTLKITSAMKMVASAKLRKAQSAIAGKLPYEQKLHHILAGMLQDDDLQKALHDSLGFGGSSNSPLELQDVPPDALPDRENVRRVAIVAFSSNSAISLYSDEAFPFLSLKVQLSNPSFI